jgi:mercuric ion binding protein
VARLIALLALIALAPAAAGGERTATLDVRGMTCAACPITVRKVLKRVPGVADASVDLKSATAEVKFDSDRVQPDDFAKAVTGAGFPATVRR